MIKVGILGAETTVAGELLRLLVHHPEVELIAAFSPGLRGRAASSLHRGIIGDTELRFTDEINLNDIDLAFITSAKLDVSQDIVLPEELRVIVIQDTDGADINPPFDKRTYVPGVSEMFRKPLVRGAVASRILPPATSVALILLYPLALHLLLNESINLSIQIPKFKEPSLIRENMKKELDSLLSEVQLSFKGVKNVTVASSDTIRAVTVEAELTCGISEEEIEKIYNSIYDDHNFTFMVRKDPSPSEVAGTHKCLIYITKPSEDKIRVKAVADSVLRGGAGDAIHAMNLLFGLFEKTGLAFPAGLAFRDEE